MYAVPYRSGGRRIERSLLWPKANKAAGAVPGRKNVLRLIRKAKLAPGATSIVPAQIKANDLQQDQPHNTGVPDIQGKTAPK